MGPTARRRGGSSPSTGGSARVASPSSWASPTSWPACSTPCATAGSPTPTSSAARGAPARRRPPGSSPGRSTAQSPEGGEPCGVCASCVEIARGSSLDVHELDAASNNGVDAMRDLVAHAALATPGRWKVYIVDEVHMLSNAAANALLKTLEEPPGHVVFVLATTDPQKVPATIRSPHPALRVPPLRLRDPGRAPAHRARQRAAWTSTRTCWRWRPGAGRGSARDALSALDQLAASGSVGDERARAGGRPRGPLRGGRAGDPGGGRRPARGGVGAPSSWRSSSSTTCARPSCSRSPRAGLGRRSRARTACTTRRRSSACPGWSGPWSCSDGPRSTCARPPTPRVVLEVTLVRVAERLDLDPSVSGAGRARAPASSRRLAGRGCPERGRRPAAQADAGPGPQPRRPADARRLCARSARRPRPDRRRLAEDEHRRPPAAEAAGGARASRPIATPWCRPGATTSCARCRRWPRRSTARGASSRSRTAPPSSPSPTRPTATAAPTCSRPWRTRWRPTSGSASPIRLVLDTEPDTSAVPTRPTRPTSAAGAAEADPADLGDDDFDPDDPGRAGGDRQPGPGRGSSRRSRVPRRSRPRCTPARCAR